MLPYRHYREPNVTIDDEKRMISGKKRDELRRQATDEGGDKSYWLQLKSHQHNLYKKMKVAVKFGPPGADTVYQPGDVSLNEYPYSTFYGRSLSDAEKHMIVPFINFKLLERQLLGPRASIARVKAIQEGKGDQFEASLNDDAKSSLKVAKQRQLNAIDYGIELSEPTNETFKIFVGTFVHVCNHYDVSELVLKTFSTEEQFHLRNFHAMNTFRKELDLMTASLAKQRFYMDQPDRCKTDLHMSAFNKAALDAFLKANEWYYAYQNHIIDLEHMPVVLDYKKVTSRYDVRMESSLALFYEVQDDEGPLSAEYVTGFLRHPRNGPPSYFDNAFWGKVTGGRLQPEGWQSPTVTSIHPNVGCEPNLPVQSVDI